ncbi:gp436 family protein [Ancylobacter pratisalsi]|uniref:DUF1320 domain-containing protein n=1 Tax=Ancylobacter pratisalsi TaxID=1745854 RepID=A0A6P1YPU4_9HYPH|nr:DUF1320 domain-containing protein [Ancylobacter pratisalsi]QIB34751.1 DUF1320 domain-containing protein [Ancylobacter pratisalsi]
MYATVNDMISRFGEEEMTRLSVADGDMPEAVQRARIEQAINDASRLIDSYLRKRYATPVAPAPAELVRSACLLARYDLALGGDREPTEQMRLARKEIIGWLEVLAIGKASLEGVVALASDSGARTSDRAPAFTTRAGGGL